MAISWKTVGIVVAAMSVFAVAVFGIIVNEVVIRNKVALAQAVQVAEYQAAYHAKIDTLCDQMRETKPPGRCVFLARAVLLNKDYKEIGSPLYYRVGTMGAVPLNPDPVVAEPPLPRECLSLRGDKGNDDYNCEIFKPGDPGYEDLKAQWFP